MPTRGQTSCSEGQVHLSELPFRKVEDLLAQQLEDNHAVLAQGLAGFRSANQIRNEALPVVRPLLLQHLQQGLAKVLALRHPNTKLYISIHLLTTAK